MVTTSFRNPDLSLAIRRAALLCPAGDLDQLAAHGPGLDLSGRCEADRLKELAERLPGVQLRRTPRLARLALRAALDLRPEITERTALVLVSAYGSAASTCEFLDSLLDDGAALASPTAFSHSVTNMTAAYLSQHLQLTGPCLSLSQWSLGPALEAAGVLLNSGQADDVLLGTVAEASETMMAIEKAAGRRPARPAEGAVFFHLARPSETAEEMRLEYLSPAPEAAPAPAGPRAFSPLAPALELALAWRLAGPADAGGEPSFIDDAGQGLIVLRPGGRGRR